MHGIDTAAIATGASIAADRSCADPLFVTGWLSDPGPPVTADRSVGAHAQRLSGGTSARAGSCLAAAASRYRRRTGGVLVPDLLCARDPARLHDRRVPRCRKRDDSTRG